MPLKVVDIPLLFAYLIVYFFVLALHMGLISLLTIQLIAPVRFFLIDSQKLY